MNVPIPYVRSIVFKSAVTKYLDAVDLRKCTKYLDGVDLRKLTQTYV